MNNYYPRINTNTPPQKKKKTPTNTMKNELRKIQKALTQ